MSTHTKEKLTVCICAGTAKHLTASIKRMREDGWQESGHRSYHPEGDWHWQHMSKENPQEALRMAREALREAAFHCFTIQDCSRVRGLAEDALAALGDQPEEGA